MRTGTRLFLVQHFFNPGVPREFCDICDTPFTIKHLLIDCPAFRIQRIPITSYFAANNIEISEGAILGDKFPHSRLFDFLKVTGFYNKI